MTRPLLPILFAFLFSSAFGQTDSLYRALIKQADRAYSFKRWGQPDRLEDLDKYEAAKTKYEAANQECPNNKYPKDRIAEIDRILDAIRYELAQLAGEYAYSPYLATKEARPFQLFLKNYADSGKLGVKSGEGFYSYPNPKYKEKGFIAG